MVLSCFEPHGLLAKWCEKRAAGGLDGDAMRRQGMDVLVMDGEANVSIQQQWAA